MILVDADACPVKDEIYTIAYRHNLPCAFSRQATCATPIIR
jgi:uncharacterized protein YaiI (UPF0178 family)